MGRKAKPWLRKQNKTWYVNIDGKQINLGKDKTEAFKAFHKLMASEVKPIGSLTIAELLDKYLQWAKEHRAERTFEWYTHHLQRFLDNLPNQTMAASSLRPHHINDYFAGKGWSANYRRGAMQCIQRAYKWAVINGYLGETPVSHLEKPSVERREEYPSQAEYEQMLENTSDNFKDVLMFAFETGARPQEICGIKPEHYKKGRIQFTVEESKGKKRNRVIFLTKNAKAIVERRLDGEYIFLNRDGLQWTADAVNCAIDRIAEKTGKRWCLYSLRHLFTNRMLEAGVDHITVASWLGHKDASLISKFYQHIGNNQDFLQKQLDSVGQNGPAPATQ